MGLEFLASVAPEVTMPDVDLGSTFQSLLDVFTDVGGQAMPYILGGVAIYAGYNITIKLAKRFTSKVG